MRRGVSLFAFNGQLIARRMALTTQEPSPVDRRIYSLIALQQEQRNQRLKELDTIVASFLHINVSDMQAHVSQYTAVLNGKTDDMIYKDLDATFQDVLTLSERKQQELLKKIDVFTKNAVDLMKGSSTDANDLTNTESSLPLSDSKELLTPLHVLLALEQDNQLSDALSTMVAPMLGMNVSDVQAHVSNCNAVLQSNTKSDAYKQLDAAFQDVKDALELSDAKWHEFVNKIGDITKRAMNAAESPTTNRAGQLNPLYVVLALLENERYRQNETNLTKMAGFMSVSRKELQKHVSGVDDQVEGGKHSSTTSSGEWNWEDCIAVAKASGKLLSWRCRELTMIRFDLTDGRRVNLSELPKVMVASGGKYSSFSLPDFVGVNDYIEAAARYIKAQLVAPPTAVVMPQFDNPWVDGCGMAGWDRIGLKTQGDKPVALVCGLFGSGKTRVAAEHPEYLFKEYDGRIAVLYQSLDDPAYKHDLDKFEGSGYVWFPFIAALIDLNKSMHGEKEEVDRWLENTMENGSTYLKKRNDDAYALVTKMLNNAAKARTESKVKLMKYGSERPMDVVLVIDEVDISHSFVRGVISRREEIYAHMKKLYGENVGIALVGTGTDAFETYEYRQGKRCQPGYRKFILRHDSGSCWSILDHLYQYKTTTDVVDIRKNVCARNKVFNSLGTNPRIVVELCHELLPRRNVNAGSMVEAGVAAVRGYSEMNGLSRMSTAKKDRLLHAVHRYMMAKDAGCSLYGATAYYGGLGDDAAKDQLKKDLAICNLHGLLIVDGEVVGDKIEYTTSEALRIVACEDFIPLLRHGVIVSATGSGLFESMTAVMVCKGLRMDGYDVTMLPEPLRYPYPPQEAGQYDAERQAWSATSSRGLRGIHASDLTAMKRVLLGDRKRAVVFLNGRDAPFADVIALCMPPDEKPGERGKVILVSCQHAEKVQNVTEMAATLGLRSPGRDMSPQYVAVCVMVDIVRRAVSHRDVALKGITLPTPAGDASVSADSTAAATSNTLDRTLISRLQNNKSSSSEHPSVDNTSTEPRGVLDQKSTCLLKMSSIPVEKSNDILECFYNVAGVKVKFVLQGSGGPTQPFGECVAPTAESDVKAASDIHEVPNVTHVTLRTAGLRELGPWDKHCSKIVEDCGGSFSYGFFLFNSTDTEENPRDIDTMIFLDEHKRRRLVTSVPSAFPSILKNYVQYRLDYGFDSSNAFIVVLEEGKLQGAADRPSVVAQALSQMLELPSHAIKATSDLRSVLQEHGKDQRRCVCITNSAHHTYSALYQVAVGLYQPPPIMLKVRAQLGTIAAGNGS